jgi:YVTN family beta-propeller protein
MMRGLALSADGRHLWLTTQTTNTVTVIDASAHRVLATLPVGAAPKRLAVGVVSFSEPEALEGGDPQ